MDASAANPGDLPRLVDLVRSRRSVRRYQPLPVDPALVRKILEAARWAPSNWNSQPWRFVACQEPATITVISELLYSRARHARNALTGIPGMEQMVDHCLRYFEVVRDSPVLIIVGYKPLAHRFEAALDDLFCEEAGKHRWSPTLLGVGMASQNLLLAAHAAGLGACFHSGPVAFLRGALQERLDLPRSLELAGLITLGWPEAREHPEPGRKPLDKLVRAVGPGRA